MTGNRSNTQTSTQAERAPTQSGGNVQLSEQQSSRISSTIARTNVRPVTNVNFSLSAGTVVPRSVRVQRLPSSIVSIVPQYRGYSYFVTTDQIVIVEPRAHKIVSVLPYGGSRTTTTVREKASQPKFSQTQRQTIRRQVSEGRSATTSGRGTVTRTIEVGEAVPEDVELMEFPTTIYREVPAVRTYRYYRTDNNIMVVDPADRRVIEIID